MAYIGFLGLLFLAIPAIEASGSGSWGYGENGIQEWYHEFPACKGNRQSPIDIPVGFCAGKVVRPFKFFGLDQAMTVSVVNNGHSVQANLDTQARKKVFFNINGRKFIVEQFHFHWGKVGSHKGSEHTIGGRASPMELHVVAFEEKFGSVGNAADKRGLAVLGFLIEEGHPNEFLRRLVRVIPKLEASHGNAPSPQSINGFRFVDLIGKKALEEGFYRYSGSLTTPPCYEGVVWTVFRAKLSVSRQQLSVFRDHTGIKHNYRAVRPRNGRAIRCS